MDGKSEAVAVLGSLRFSLLPISWPSLPQEEEAGSVFAKLINKVALVGSASFCAVICNV